MVFVPAPAKGAGIPQEMSRVSERGLRPSLIHERLKFLAFSGKFGFLSMYCLSRSENLGRSKNQCCESLGTGVSWQMTQYGLIRSVGSRILPQLSHWSPRAPGA